MRHVDPISLHADVMVGVAAEKDAKRKAEDEEESAASASAPNDGGGSAVTEGAGKAGGSAPRPPMLRRRPVTGSSSGTLGRRAARPVAYRYFYCHHQVRRSLWRATTTARLLLMY